MTKNLLVSTASPYKFPASVLSAVTGEAFAAGSAEAEFADADRLSALTGTQQPVSLQALREKPVLHTTVCTKEEMKQVMYRALGL